MFPWVFQRWTSCMICWYPYMRMDINICVIIYRSKAYNLHHCFSFFPSPLVYTDTKFSFNLVEWNYAGKGYALCLTHILFWLWSIFQPWLRTCFIGLCTLNLYTSFMSQIYSAILLIHYRNMCSRWNKGIPSPCP